jgi:hypothetical protein
MSYATSRPIVNRFFGGADVAATLRTHLLANVSNRKPDKLRVVSHAVRNSVRFHPQRVNRVMRRNAVQRFVLDLVN